MHRTDHLNFICAHPAGLTVQGLHAAVGAPVRADLLRSYNSLLAHRQSCPAKLDFDGHRAVLQGFEQRGDVLHLQTAYRTYAQGCALRDALVRAPRDAGPERWLTPDPGVSWGMSLLTFVLLPFGRVLCAQRGASVLTCPGEWRASFTEMVEPDDVRSDSMAPLLARLVDEELTPLIGLGSHRFIGLGVRTVTYTWHLVSVLDLRAPTEALHQALAALQPDAESDAWAVLAAPHAPSCNWFPHSLREAALDELFDGALALHLARH